MLDEATKKAIVTEMAPPEMATHLMPNADQYNAYAKMKWHSYVILKLPSQLTTMWTDHVEQGGEKIDYVGGQQQATERARAKAETETMVAVRLDEARKFFLNVEPNLVERVPFGCLLDDFDMERILGLCRVR